MLHGSREAVERGRAGKGPATQTCSWAEKLLQGIATLCPKGNRWRSDKLAKRVPACTRTRLWIEDARLVRPSTMRRRRGGDDDTCQ